MMLKDFEFKV